MKLENATLRAADGDARAGARLHAGRLEAAAGTDQVSTNIEGVSRAAEATGQATNQVMQAAGELV